ncbi:MAG TPA: hypothetical protein ENH11_06335, partial [Candidatus Acetothermia bacterium]|nr:hypothetical protein [Candidatus Acetothermia bacterium]
MFTKKNLTIGVAIVALVTVLISGTTIFAAGGTSNSGQNIESNVQNPSYIGSISAPANAGSQTLASLAKITASDAEKAALAKFPGATVLKTQLGDENGVLVYAVELQTASGIKDVKVDAGNAQILYTDNGGGIEATEHGAPETGETEPAG